MENEKRLNKKSLPEKERFYSSLNLESITDSDYNHAKRICNDFETKTLGK